MARTSKKTKAATVKAADTAADPDVRSVGEAEAVAAVETGAETASVAASGETVFIPLNKLKKSPRNARIYARNCHGMAIHPTEKPSGLIEILIRTSCPQGGLVGDWFAGSGAAGEACRLSGRRYVGCEIDAGMAERARLRIASVLSFSGAQP